MSRRATPHPPNDRGRRDLRVKIIAHWFNADAFFALVLTGTLFFLRRRLGLTPGQGAWLHQAHLVLGALYFFGPALIFLVGGPRAGLDILRKIGRPNVLGQLTGKWLLAASGLAMHLIPGPLPMYALHLLCYLAVCALATVHICTVLVRPRRARNNSSGREAPPPRHRPDAPGGLLFATALLLLALSPVPFAADSFRAAARLGLKFVHKVEALASPGPLGAAHAALDRPEGCPACHHGARGVGNSRCLACHQEVASRMKARLGYHGKLAGDCFVCHQEHRGRGGDLMALDMKTFDHSRAVFPLKGRHRQVECAQCHKAMKHFSQAPTRCDACHGDPHQGQFTGLDCTACHREAGWERLFLKFNHQTQTRFPLTGHHAQVDCAECHLEGHYRGTSMECSSCHIDEK